jgi:hypothetical protein
MPRQIRETFSPVDPSRLCSIFFLSVYAHRGDDQRDPAQFGDGRALAEHGEADGGGGGGQQRQHERERPAGQPP